MKVAMADPIPAPATPEGGKPKWPKISAQLSTMLRRVHDQEGAQVDLGHVDAVPVAAEGEVDPEGRHGGEPRPEIGDPEADHLRVIHQQRRRSHRQNTMSTAESGIREHEREERARR